MCSRRQGLWMKYSGCHKFCQSRARLLSYTIKDKDFPCDLKELVNYVRQKGLIQYSASSLSCVRNRPAVPLLRRPDIFISPGSVSHDPDFDPFLNFLIMCAIKEIKNVLGDKSASLLHRLMRNVTFQSFLQPDSPCQVFRAQSASQILKKPARRKQN